MSAQAYLARLIVESRAQESGHRASLRVHPATRRTRRARRSSDTRDS